MEMMRIRISANPHNIRVAATDFRAVLVLKRFRKSAVNPSYLFGQELRISVINCSSSSPKVTSNKKSMNGKPLNAADIENHTEADNFRTDARANELLRTFRRETCIPSH